MSETGGQQQPAPAGGQQQPAPAGGQQQPAQQPAPGITFDTWEPTLKTKMQGRGITPDAAGFQKLAQSFDAADRTLGGAKDFIAVPGDGAPKEAWDRVYSAIGRPASPAEYPINVPAGTNVEPKFMDYARSTMFAMGVPASKAQEFVAGYLQFGEQQRAAELEAGNQIITSLKAQHGEAFNSKVAAGQAAVRALNLKPEVLAKIEKSAGTAEMTELFLALGDKLGEGNFVGGGGGGGAPTDPSQMTPDQAQAEIVKLQGDEAFMKKYRGKNEAGHDEAVKRMEAIFAATKRKPAT